MYHLNVCFTCAWSVRIEMFPCSALQKADWDQFFPHRPRYWLADAKLCIQTRRCSIPCEALASPVRGAHPWQFLPTASFPWEKDAQERLSRTSLFLELLCSEKNYLIKQVTSPAVAPLLTCSFLPLPHLHGAPSSDSPLHHFHVSSLL